MREGYRTALIAIIIVVAIIGGTAYYLSRSTPTPTLTPTPTPTSPFPVTVIDDLGRSVSIEGKPERIVSMAPSATEILFALGLGDKVVGVTDACDYPPEALNITKISEPVGRFQIEKIVKLDPDIVVMDRYLDLYPPGDWLSKIEEVNLKVIVLYAGSFDDVFDDILIVGKATGSEEEANELMKFLREKYDSITGKTGSLPEEEKPRVFTTGWYDGTSDPWTSGFGTFADEIINLAGGINVAGIRNGFFQMGIEALIWADPQVIVVLEDERFPTPTYKSILSDERFSELTAVMEGEIYQVDASLFSRPGPRLVKGLEELAEILHPELFK